MVFDVESIGLHGEGYGVGWVVISNNGTKLKEGCFACDPFSCKGSYHNHKWAMINIPKLSVTHPNPSSMRTDFWNEWVYWKKLGATLVADSAWPVEARFLASAVDDDISREIEGPYPLHDLSSILLGLGHQLEIDLDRLPCEQPKHNPLMDARQSARILANAIKHIYPSTGLKQECKLS